MCAFLIRPLFVASKMAVMVKKSAHVPICVCDSERISTIKLTKPKKVTENRCRKV
jgi:hypothetical protein